MRRTKSYKRNPDWFRFWLEGEENPNPDKVQRYIRWRELRNLQQESEVRTTPK